ncbi:MAG: hypothetical protein IH960_10300 [Chloroflexi bacterium]|nr:hypothetical protein [Chloroflexota bacterium]MCH8228937.1 hypothetical protein [Chloroflexota bacterium]MCH8910194.1 hypothetical protein [Chloroflexota bacterium]
MLMACRCFRIKIPPKVSQNLPSVAVNRGCVRQGCLTAAARSKS